MTATDLLQVGPLEVDVFRYTVRLDGRDVRLTRIEFDMLCKLVETPDRCVPKAELAAHIWGGGPRSFGRERTVESHACRLRKKLGGGFVLNVWGVGYRLVAALP